MSTDADLRTWIPLVMRLARRATRLFRLDPDDAESCALENLHRALRDHDPVRQELRKFIARRVWLRLLDLKRDYRGERLRDASRKIHRSTVPLLDPDRVRSREPSPGQEMEQEESARRMLRGLLPAERHLLWRTVVEGALLVEAASELGIHSARGTQLRQQALAWLAQTRERP